jgi:hypothetical protein
MTAVWTGADCSLCLGLAFGAYCRWLLSCWSLCCYGHPPSLLIRLLMMRKFL